MAPSKVHRGILDFHRNSIATPCMNSNRSERFVYDDGRRTEKSPEIKKKRIRTIGTTTTDKDCLGKLSREKHSRII